MTKRKSLSTVVADSLRQKITSGSLQPGTQLSTEAELCGEYDVSRTVIREAVARLRSEGILVAHQGRGIFVSSAPSPRGFSISEDALKTLPETISLLELRLSVEVESAGLCADRRTDDEAEGIRTLMEQVDARQEDPNAVEIHYDYDFHLAIARATRNEFILGFLTYLKPMIVPRFRLGHIIDPHLQGAYYARIHREHKAIVDAIVDQDAAAARRAMRRHLMNSLERVRAFAHAAGIGEGTDSQRTTANALFADLAKSARPAP